MRGSVSLLQGAVLVSALSTALLLPAAAFADVTDPADPPVFVPDPTQLPPIESEPLAPLDPPPPLEGDFSNEPGRVTSTPPPVVELGPPPVIPPNWADSVPSPFGPAGSAAPGAGGSGGAGASSGPSSNAASADVVEDVAAPATPVVTPTPTPTSTVRTPAPVEGPTPATPTALTPVSDSAALALPRLLGIIAGGLLIAIGALAVIGCATARRSVAAVAAVPAMVRLAPTWVLISGSTVAVAGAILLTLSTALS
jgi:hypothetical protein